MNATHVIQSDTPTRIVVESHLIYAIWLAKAAYGNCEAMLEVRTSFVGEGAPVKLTGRTEGGKKLGTVETKIFGNRLRFGFPIPKNVPVDDLVYVEVKLPKHGLKGETNSIPTRPPIEIRQMKWSAPEARRGDVLTLTCDFETPIPDETDALIIVYEYDRDGYHDPIAKIPAVIKHKKIELQWEYEYHEDTDEIPTQEELQRYGKNYNPPEYFFVVVLDEVKIGVGRESGLLVFKDSIEFSVTDSQNIPYENQEITFQFADGSEKNCTSDENGKITIDDIPPGKCRIKKIRQKNNDKKNNGKIKLISSTDIFRATISCKKDLEKRTFKTGATHQLKLAGLYLYPVRYAVLEKEYNYTDFFEPGVVTLSFRNNADVFKPDYRAVQDAESKAIKTISPPGMPKLAGREYVLTLLREGWVYIFNASKKIWHEYEVLETLQFMKCQWSSPVEDIRPANDAAVDYLELNRTDVYYCAYSDVQWSQKYCARLEASEEERKKAMQMVDAARVLDGEKNDHVIDPADADCVINSSMLTFTNGSESLATIPANACYFGLNDPIGIADQLALEVANFFERIEAMVQSVQTGVDPKIIRKSLKEGKDTAALQDEKTLEEAMALHKMAMMLYQIGFGTPENTKKLGAHLDKDRIEKLLAVNERKVLRQNLIESKSCLLEFLKSDYYQNSLCAYRDNTDERKLVGKMRISSHLPWLAAPANAKDKLLDLPGIPASDEQQASMTFLAEVLEEKNELGKVIAENNPVKLENTGLEHAVIQTWDNILNSFDDLAKSKKGKLTILIRRLNSIKIEGFSEPFFEELDMLGFHKRMKSLGNPEFFPLPDAETLRGFEKIGDKIVDIKQITLSEQVVQTCQPNHGMYRIADKLTNSIGWNRFVGGVAYINLAMTMRECLKEENWKSKIEGVKAVLSLVAVASDVVEAHVAIARIKLLGQNAEKEAIKNLYKLGLRLTASGYFLGAAISVVDSGINFYEGDWDSATAYSVSAILGVITGIGVILHWNPIGLIALFTAALGSTILAVLLEDPPLERYVKNCILRAGLSNKILPRPFENIVDLVKNNASTVKIGFKQWNRLVFASRDLMDIIFGYSADTKLEYEYQHDAAQKTEKWTNQLSGFIREGISGRITQVKKIHSKITFRMFMEHISRLEYEVRIYPEGLKNAGYFFSIDKNSGEKLVYKNEDGKLSTTLNTEVPDDVFAKLLGYGDIIFLTRLHYNDKLVFPENQEANPRFIAIKNSTLWNTGSALDRDGGGGVSAISSSQLVTTITYLNLFGDTVRIGTEKEVTNEVMWRKNE